VEATNPGPGALALIDSAVRLDHGSTGIPFGPAPTRACNSIEDDPDEVRRFAARAATVNRSGRGDAQ